MNLRVELKETAPLSSMQFFGGQQHVARPLLAKELDVEERNPLFVKGAQVPHKRALALKLSDIQVSRPQFLYHKILMEEDYAPSSPPSKKSKSKKSNDVIIKGGDVCTARKLSTFSKLATMDPPGDIMVQTSQPKRSLTPVIFGRTIYKDALRVCPRTVTGTSIIPPWQTTICQNELKRKRSPPICRVVCKFLKSSLRPDLVLPVQS
ncbi:hypothetical protein Tco_0031078 [Tanacetum coccineum]